MKHLAINFHYVGTLTYPFPGIASITPASFSDIVNRLARDWSFVSLDDVCAAAREERSLPEQSCLLTFDDGLRCQYEEALPTLDRLGVPAAFFALSLPYTSQVAVRVHRLQWLRAKFGDCRISHLLNELAARLPLSLHVDAVDESAARTAYRYDELDAARLKYFLNYLLPATEADAALTAIIAELGLDERAIVSELYMSAEMLIDLGKRGYLGSHAESHSPLAKLQAQESQRELRDSKAVLERLSASRISALSYPLGNEGAVDREVATIAQAEGYCLAYTMERAWNASLNDPLMLARIDANDLVRLSEFGPRSRYFIESQKAV